jgi:hypothetical protein
LKKTDRIGGIGIDFISPHQSVHAITFAARTARPPAKYEAQRGDEIRKSRLEATRSMFTLRASEAIGVNDFLKKQAVHTRHPAAAPRALRHSAISRLSDSIAPRNRQSNPLKLPRLQLDYDTVFTI